MSGITVAVVVSVVILSAAALVATAFAFVRHIKRLKASVQAMHAQLEPTLAELNREMSIAERGLSDLGRGGS